MQDRYQSIGRFFNWKIICLSAHVCVCMPYLYVCLSVCRPVLIFADRIIRITWFDWCSLDCWSVWIWLKVHQFTPGIFKYDCYVGKADEQSATHHEHIDITDQWGFQLVIHKYAEHSIYWSVCGSVSVSLWACLHISMQGFFFILVSAYAQICWPMV